MARRRRAGRRFFRARAAPSRGGPRIRHAQGGSRPARGRASQDARARGLRVDLVAEEVRPVATDVTEDTIREVALPMGFVDVKVCAVSEVWSGLKLVIRKSERP